MLHGLHSRCSCCMGCTACAHVACTAGALTWVAQHGHGLLGMATGTLLSMGMGCLAYEHGYLSMSMAWTRVAQHEHGMDTGCLA